MMIFFFCVAVYKNNKTKSLPSQPLGSYQGETQCKDVKELSQKRRRRRKFVSRLVVWAQSITKAYIRAEQKLHSISKLFISQVITPQVICCCCFLAYLCSAGIKHGNLHPARWPSLFCRPRQDSVLATANRGKTWEKFWKKCRWMYQKGRN